MPSIETPLDTVHCRLPVTMPGYHEGRPPKTKAFCSKRPHGSLITAAIDVTTLAVVRVTPTWRDSRLQRLATNILSELRSSRTASAVR